MTFSRFLKKHKYPLGTVVGLLLLGTILVVAGLPVVGTLLIITGVCIGSGYMIYK